MLRAMLYLASKSPRRRELLGRLGVAFDVLDLDIPEQRVPSEEPADYVLRVAREKAAAGLDRLGRVPDALVLGSDTEVVLDDEVFGKPRDALDAGEMLQRLSGRTHAVISAVAIESAERSEHAMSVSEGTFAQLTGAQIDAYLRSGEYEGKAGAYAIQGLAEVFVARLSGSYSGVMGLPLFETGELLARFGFGPYAAVVEGGR